MPMILSSRFYDDVMTYRLIYFGGIFGTGKTLLSVVIAEHFFRMGYAVFANFACSFNSDITPQLLESGLSHAVIIMDEAGSRSYDARSWQSDENKRLNEVMAYCRKLDLIFLFPSVTEIDKRARKLVVGRNMVGQRLLNTMMLDKMLWHYFVLPCQDQRYSFFMLAPYAYFNLYDTTHIPSARDDGAAFLIDDFQKRFSYDRDAAMRERDQLKQRLMNGSVIPGIRPISTALERGRGSLQARLKALKEIRQYE